MPGPQDVLGEILACPDEVADRFFLRRGIRIAVSSPARNSPGGVAGVTPIGDLSSQSSRDSESPRRTYRLFDQSGRGSRQNE